MEALQPPSRPGPGEILLRLRCAGLCGTDLFKLRYGTVPEGTVLGHEVVGTVETVGDGVLGFLPGDRVAVAHHVACGECDLCRRGSEPLCPAFRENLLVPGGFSEWILVREQAVRQAMFGLPPHIPDETAVFLEPAACVLRGIRKVQSPASAVVLGGGSMGLLHLLVLKAVVPGVRVAVLDPLEERARYARELGAVEAVEAIGDVDAVFDTAGGAEALRTALHLVRPGGTVVLFAHAAAGEQAGFDLNAFFKAEKRLVATYSSSLAEQREIHRLMSGRRLDPSPLVTHRLPLSRFDEAVALARDRRALKVLLTPEETEETTG
ncbi:MAG: alcohol dehydrogenase catalytic domain-containing protein [Acidobacteriota bacterium]